MSNLNLLTVLFLVPVLLATILFTLYIYAMKKQPRRLKAKVGLAGSVFWLLFSIFVFGNFGYSGDDVQLAFLLLPLAILGPLLSGISTYRLFKHWDPKYWDPQDPGVLGWNQH
ncbi:MAG: hypothetical protein NVSMB31_02030 [Vulcanimicrobiaceae bacterium]